MDKRYLDRGPGVGSSILFQCLLIVAVITSVSAAISGVTLPVLYAASGTAGSFSLLPPDLSGIATTDLSPTLFLDLYSGGTGVTMNLVVHFVGYGLSAPTITTTAPYFLSYTNALDNPFILCVGSVYNPASVASSHNVMPCVDRITPPPTTFVNITWVATASVIFTVSGMISQSWPMPVSLEAISGLVTPLPTTLYNVDAMNYYGTSHPLVLDTTTPVAIDVVNYAGSALNQYNALPTNIAQVNSNTFLTTSLPIIATDSAIPISEPIPVFLVTQSGTGFSKANPLRVNLTNENGVLPVDLVSINRHVIDDSYLPGALPIFENVLYANYTNSSNLINETGLLTSVSYVILPLDHRATDSRADSVSATMTIPSGQFTLVEYANGATVTVNYVTGSYATYIFTNGSADLTISASFIDKPIIYANGHYDVQLCLGDIEVIGTELTCVLASQSPRFLTPIPFSLRFVLTPNVPLYTLTVDADFMTNTNYYPDGAVVYSFLIVSSWSCRAPLEGLASPCYMAYARPGVFFNIMMRSSYTHVGNLPLNGTASFLQIGGYPGNVGGGPQLGSVSIVGGINVNTVTNPVTISGVDIPVFFDNETVLGVSTYLGGPPGLFISTVTQPLSTQLYKSSYQFISDFFTNVYEKMKYDKA